MKSSQPRMSSPWRRTLQISNGIVRAFCGATALASLLALGCGATATGTGGTGSDTSWLSSCNSDCDVGSCLCGVCTRSCEDGDECADVSAASSCELASRLKSCGENSPQRLCVAKEPLQSSSTESDAGGSGSDSRSSEMEGDSDNDAVMPQDGNVSDTSAGASETEASQGGEVSGGVGTANSLPKEGIIWLDGGQEVRPYVGESAYQLQPKVGVSPGDFDASVGGVSEQQVIALLKQDRAALAAEAELYTRYVSLHFLHNAGATSEILDLTRVALSLALNATSRHNSELMQPVALDAAGLVYRFDVRWYWGLTQGGGIGGGFGNGGADGPLVDEENALARWQRILQGNIDYPVQPEANADVVPVGFPSDYEGDSQADNAGFTDEYVEASQLVYTLTRPDVYAELLEISFIVSILEDNLELQAFQGVGSYQYMLAAEAANERGQRLIWRGETTAGSYWRTTDMFADNPFSFFDRPMPEFIGDEFSQVSVSVDGADGLQDSQSLIIFTLPNQLPAFTAAGKANQTRMDIPVFAVLDEGKDELLGDGFFDAGGRGDVGERRVMLVGAPCFRCHARGVIAVEDGLRPYLETSNDELEEAAMAELLLLYPDDTELATVFKQDNAGYGEAFDRIQEAMSTGLLPKADPITYVTAAARTFYGYDY